MKRVKIYTDGACRGNPGPGGWATVLIYEGREKVEVGGSGYTTNNRMELRAAIAGLRALREPCEVEVVTDSEYVRLGASERLPRWKAKNEVYGNMDLWALLEEAMKPHTITWTWVRGHSGDLYNDKVDSYAREGVGSYVGRDMEVKA